VPVTALTTRHDDMCARRWSSRARARTTSWFGSPSARRGATTPTPAIELTTPLACLEPGERHELTAVLGDVLDDRIVAVENGAIAVGDLHRGLALDDHSAEHPGLAVDLNVALDVDQAAEGEIAVHPEVAVHVEEALAVAAIVRKRSRRVLSDVVV